MRHGSQSRCPSLETLFRRVRGDLPADERAAHDEHLRTCARCSFRAEDARELLALERALRDRPTDPVAAPGGASAARPRAFGHDAWQEGFDDVVLVQRGGQGVVYRAVQRSTGRRVAIKVLRRRPTSPRTQARFEREARILGQLDSERGVCPILEYAARGGETFLVMPFVEGETLARRLARAAALHRGGAPLREAWGALARPGPRELPARAKAARSLAGEPCGLAPALALVERIARAAQAFHERGIVHRDLTPRNVMVRPDGRPVVLDFGLALDRSERGAGRLTHAGELFGTPAYMAPEQAAGRAAEADARTDVYALGAILYEVLTLRAPYEGPRTCVIVQRVLRGTLPRPRRVQAEVPRELEAVCLKAMAPDPGRRHASALALADDLRRLRQARACAAGRPSRPVPRLVRAPRRGACSSLAAALAAVVAVGLPARSAHPAAPLPSPASAPEASERSGSPAGARRAVDAAESAAHELRPLPEDRTLSLPLVLRVDAGTALAARRKD